jgi:hypothetical protein
MDVLCGKKLRRRHDGSLPKKVIVESNSAQHMTPDVAVMHEFIYCCSRKPSESQFTAGD